jgi:putative DNA primase/helicase
MQHQGTLAQWQTFVAAPCKGSPILVFSACVAFAGPLLRFAGLDCGAFHLYGASSKGKTTALQVPASAWGSGADPAISQDSYIGRWNTTGNALEATAAAHNDMLLALDEMGTCDARDFGKVIYDLFGGKGKSCLNKNSTLQAQRTWRIQGLSTGEISVQQKIKEDSGRKPKTGHLVRMVDIPIREGVIRETHGKSAGDIAMTLKKATARFYGTAGPAFLEGLIRFKPDTPALQHWIQAEVDALHNCDSTLVKPDLFHNSGESDDAFPPALPWLQPGE